MNNNTMKGSTLIGGTGDNERQVLDHYPTPKEATIALMNFLHKEVSFYFDSPLNVWEPACGNGAMAAVIKDYGHNVIATDIKNYGYGIGELDFLTHSEAFDVDAIITNPPFNISAQFVELSMGRRIVCMLLKSQYWHAKKRLELFNRTQPQWVLPLTWRPDFMEHTRLPGEKGNPTMDVAWTVWIKGSKHRTQYQPLLKP